MSYEQDAATLSPVEVAWLAGILEGEGCFIIQYRKLGPPKGGGCIKIQLKMTDEDVILRAAKIMQSKVAPPIIPKKPTHKIQFSTSLSGYRARKILEIILPFMGIRRSIRIRELMTEWDNRAVKHWPPNKPALCHPDQPNVAGGLCRKCWRKRQWQKEIENRPST
ncbi:MAG: hypothetical protein KGJ13_09810 [Patescibacteria group bacterium]|nr:hypothetical protein [Patescibacteria group bacterium]